MNGVSLILCDRVSHVRRSLEERPDCTIVALTPEVVEECDRRHLSYVVLDSYVEPAAVNAAATATLSREYEWVRWLDRTLFDLFPEFKQLGFTPASALVFYLKRPLDWHLLPATVLLEFLKSARPSEVVVFERPLFCPALDGWGAVERPLYALLAPVLARPDARVQVRPDTELSRAERLHDTWSGRTYRLWRARAGRVVRKLRHKREPAPPTEARLVAWTGVRGSDIDSVLPLLAQRGIGVVPLPANLQAGRGTAERVERLRKRMGELAPQFLKDDAFWMPVDAVSPALRPLLSPFLERWLEFDLPQFLDKFLRARDWLSQRPFSALIGNDLESTRTSAVHLAAKSLGIPRVAQIHNGGMIQDLPPHDCIGPTQCDVFLVNGKGDVDYFDELARRHPQLDHAKNVAVGSVRLERVARPPAPERLFAITEKLKRDDGRRVVLYAPTMLMGCYRYFCEGYTSDTAYVAVQKRILKCFAEFPDVRGLYKPMQVNWTADPIPAFISKEVPNIEIVSGKLTELMWAVDAIVIDFSATAMTEVVFTDKPLVFYAGRDWARMVPEARAALGSRAAVSETPEEFERDVRALLGQRDFTPASTQPVAFTSLYCTHENDGRSAERIADIIASYTAAGAQAAAPTLP